MTPTARSADAHVREMARGLSEAQRAAICRAEQDGHLAKFFVRWWHANGRTIRSLVRKGFGVTVWSGAILTPRGEELRRHLMEKDQCA